VLRGIVAGASVPDGSVNCTHASHRKANARMLARAHARAHVVCASARMRALACSAVDYSPHLCILSVIGTDDYREHTHRRCVHACERACGRIHSMSSVRAFFERPHEGIQ
jgi:hypothetical protein